MSKKRKYTMSPAAYEARVKASARAKELRGPAKTWHTVRLDGETYKHISLIRGKRTYAQVIADVLGIKHGDVKNDN